MTNKKLVDLGYIASAKRERLNEMLQEKIKEGYVQYRDIRFWTEGINKGYWTALILKFE